MSKPKLITWHDFQCHTGFAIVADQLLQGLEEYFDIEVVAINNFRGRKFDTSRFSYVHPTKDSRQDPFNTQTLYEVVEEEQPDVIFLFQDIWNINGVIKTISEKALNAKIISYFPIDGYPLGKVYHSALELSDVIITYSDWAIKVVKEFYPDLDKPIHKLYHGVDFKNFKRLPEELIKANKEKMGWQNKFVCINVNRYQPRKQLDLTVRAFRMFSHGYNECQDCGHWQPKNLNICELCQSEDMLELGQEKKDVKLYLHTNAQSGVMGLSASDHFLTHMENAGCDLSDPDSNVDLNAHDLESGEVGFDVMNALYNCADLNLSTTIGEGCGLSLLESASVGVESIAPKNSAIPEMLGEFGQLIPNVGVVNMRNDNGSMRPIVDEKEYVLAIERVYKKWQSNGKKQLFNPDAAKRIKKEFHWDEKREFLKETLKSLLPK
jgi:glycosyltransferase involved in cell wall biosynthesis